MAFQMIEVHLQIQTSLCVRRQFSRWTRHQGKTFSVHSTFQKHTFNAGE
jgi:hypothetical protein